MKAPISNESAKTIQRYLGMTPKSQNGRHVIIDGIEYESITAAAMELGIPKWTFTYAITHGNPIPGHTVEYVEPL